MSNDVITNHVLPGPIQVRSFLRLQVDNFVSNFVQGPIPVAIVLFICVYMHKYRVISLSIN